MNVSTATFCYVITVLLCQADTTTLGTHYCDGKIEKRDEALPKTRAFVDRGV